MRSSALVRVSAILYGSLSGDDATVALAAKHVLHGENFPALFYRQTYMGSLNGIHLVPALFVSGPSVLVMRLNAVAWSLHPSASRASSSPRRPGRPAGVLQQHRPPGAATVVGDGPAGPVETPVLQRIGAMR